MKYVTETKHVPLGFGEIAGGALDGQAVTLKGAVHSPAGHGRDHLPCPAGAGRGGPVRVPAGGAAGGAV